MKLDEFIKKTLLAMPKNTETDVVVYVYPINGEIHVDDTNSSHNTLTFKLSTYEPLDLSKLHIGLPATK